MHKRTPAACTILSMLLIAVSVRLSAAAPVELYDKGTEEIVNYKKYGNFENEGAAGYKYRITDPEGLKKAAGEGIFPNTTSVLSDPAYTALKKDGGLDGNHWDYVNSSDYVRNFYKWATAQEEPGIRLYYTAFALEKSGNIAHAIKAYYALLVHFPKAIGYTYWKTPWYAGPGAMNKIRYLAENNPGLGITLEGAHIRIENGFDKDTKNDVFYINPGRLVKVKKGKLMHERRDIKKMRISKTIGEGNVKLVRYSNGHWQLLVEGKPYVVHGIAYSPSPIGLSPDNGTLNVSKDWMWADSDNNGVIDGPYETWADRNRNNVRDPDEAAVGDFQLMKEMGVNTIRLYHHEEFSKQILSDGYKRFGFRYMMGNFLGMYATGSKASWFEGTDYTDPGHKANMLESVRNMVQEYKDEPYVLMWVLGNENNYGEPGQEGVFSGSGCRARLQPDAYYAFVNEAAALIKSMDPQKRPVAVCNGDTLFLDICAEKAQEIDVFGVNAYRGEEGFGSLWQDVADEFDRPVIVTEYGCPAYHRAWQQGAAEAGQAKYHKGNWLDIENNTAGAGTGNALGGVVFEWVDEWWKAGPPPEFDPSIHDTRGQFGGPFLDGWSYEEWYGLASQGTGSDSPFLRQLRPAYFEYKKMWAREE